MTVLAVTFIIAKLKVILFGMDCAHEITEQYVQTDLIL